MSATITIEQLDRTGRVYRTATLHPRSDGDLVAKLDRVERGYNPERTRVTVTR
jgi:hypothetical protein